MEGQKNYDIQRMKAPSKALAGKPERGSTALSTALVSNIKIKLF